MADANAIDVRNAIGPIVLTPVFQGILNLAGVLHLEPLRQWDWIHPQALTYIVTTALAAVACLVPAKTNRAKIILIMAGLVTLLVSWAGYTWVSTTPPTVNNLLFYDVIAFTSFFLTYMAFGFLSARVVKFFAQAPRAS